MLPAVEHTKDQVEFLRRSARRLYNQFPVGIPDKRSLTLHRRIIFMNFSDVFKTEGEISELAELSIHKASEQ